MSEALDDDTALDNPDSTYVYEPYYYSDNAAAAIRLGQEKHRKEYGEDSLQDLIWGVKKIPRPAPLTY